MRRSFFLVGFSGSVLGLCFLAECQAFKPPEKAQESLWNLEGKPPHLAAHYQAWFQVQKSKEDPTVSWFHWKWNKGGPEHDPEKRRSDGLRDLASVNYPLIGPYNSWSPEVVLYHLKTAKAAGIQAFMVDWASPDGEENTQIPVLLEEAGKLGMRIALCYEEKVNYAGFRDAKTPEEVSSNIVRDLTYILEHYGSHPAYLKRNGVPLIIQFNNWNNGKGTRNLYPREWKEIFAKLPCPVIYGRQNLDEEYHPTMPAAFIWWTPDGGYLDRFSKRAAEMRKEGRLQFFISMICPGFDDTGVWGWGQGPRKFDRQGLSVLRDTFDRSFAGDPEIIQIVTWNDFEEGTVVEPTMENGFWYLDALETWWGKKTGRPVNLEDNRKPFLEFQKECSETERAEIPVSRLDYKPLTVEHPGILNSSKCP